MSKNIGDMNLFDYMELQKVCSNEAVLILKEKYGKYMDGFFSYLSSKGFQMINAHILKPDNTMLSFEELQKEIDNFICEKCLSGEKPYDEDAPEFLKLGHPELFLSENAPEELKNYFYNFHDYFISAKS